MNISRNAPIGVIDSGIGGLSLLKELTKLYKHESYVYFADNAYMPYGNKSVKVLKNRLVEICNYLIDTFNVKVIIIACHTASAVCLTYLQRKINVPVLGIGLENLIDDNCKIICTRATSKVYKDYNTIPCNTLAQNIEDNIFNITSLRRKIFKAISKANISETNIVLGCTHYELVAKHFQVQFTDKNFILPCKQWAKSIPINKSTSDKVGDVLMISSLATKSYIDKLWKIFKA